MGPVVAETAVEPNWGWWQAVTRSFLRSVTVDVTSPFDLCYLVGNSLRNADFVDRIEIGAD